MRVRDATLEDYEAFGRFFAAFGVPDPTPSIDWWKQNLPDAIMVDDDHGPIAYGLAYKLETMAHVLHVSVDARARNQGVGRLVMRELAQRMRARGCSEWCLSVKPDNAPAVALYERVGMRLKFPSWALALPWTSLDRLPVDDVDITKVDAAEDALIERTLGLQPARLTRPRAMGGRVMLAARARDDRTFVGVCAFDPVFPGAPLFRAKTVGIAAALLHGMKPHRLEGQVIVRLVIEDDAPLRDALLAIGADLVLEISHMVGPIPDETR